MSPDAAMPTARTACILLAALILMVTGTSAFAQGWRIVEAQGQVRLEGDGAAQPLVTGALPAPGTVVTGARGRTILMADGASAALAPGSRLSLGSGALGQDAGNVRYRVSGPPLRIQTPNVQVEIQSGTVEIAVAAASVVRVEQGRARVMQADGSWRKLEPGHIERLLSPPAPFRAALPPQPSPSRAETPAGPPPITGTIEPPRARAAPRRLFEDLP